MRANAPVCLFCLPVVADRRRLAARLSLSPRSAGKGLGDVLTDLLRGSEDGARTRRTR